MKDESLPTFPVSVDMYIAMCGIANDRMRNESAMPAHLMEPTWKNREAGILWISYCFFLCVSLQMAQKMGQIHWNCVELI